jgi:hypothetical protein
MRRLIWGAVAGLILAGAVVWAARAIEEARKPELATLLPDGALLYLEAKDFGSLVKDWNESDAMRTWLTSDNHEAFSRSRLFTRLSQAQQEFSAAAGIPTDSGLLAKVAGKESCLGLYSIGNLEFVYVTKLDQSDLESTPLWQTRGKFEQRTEGGAQFYIHRDADSKRTAAFAARDGWLVLGTREDLVANALDRLQGTKARSVSDEAWYMDAVKQASLPGDLRMVLNLAAIVPSPYFRSYWVQRNVTEMKQYNAAVSDLYRSAEGFREERILVRRQTQPIVTTTDTNPLTALAPEGASFFSVQTASDPDAVLKVLRDNFLDLKVQSVETVDEAPAPVTATDAGSAGQLDVRIDEAPVLEQQVDAYQSLRALLKQAQPSAVLKVYSTRAPEDGVFAPIGTAMVISATHVWDENSIHQSLSAALLPGLTAGRLGVDWKECQHAGIEYFALDGMASLYAAAKDHEFVLSNDADLLEQILARNKMPGITASKGGATYIAVFRHGQERPNYRALMARLDRVGHRGQRDEEVVQAGGEGPAFFSGNVASLSRAFSKVAEEKMEEKDQGDKVTQTVTYRWK